MRCEKIDRFKSGVYIIKNTVNQKCYIGSSVNVYNRYHTHKTKLGKGIHSCRHLQSSYIKHGGDKFLFSVLEYTEDITQREQFYINRISPEYNVRMVAQNNIGLPVSTETKEKIRRTLKENYKNGLESYRQEHAWIPVEQYDLHGNFIKEYKNCADAERDNGIYRGKLSSYFKNSYYQCGGFQWKIKGSDKVILNKPVLHHNAKKATVTNLETGEKLVFNSLADVSNYFNINRGSIFKCIARKPSIYKKKYLIERPSPV